MKKNRLLILILMLCGLASVFGGTSVFAASCGGVNTSIIECEEGGTGTIWHILLLVIDIITMGIGILGLIGIIVFGIQYLTAGGDVGKTTKAKKRMIEIVLGLVVFVLLWTGSQWLLPGGLLQVPSEVEEISIKFDTSSIEVGDTLKPAVNIKGDDVTFSLRSSDESIAKAYDSGTVHCVGVGNVTITAIAVDGQTAETSLSCREKKIDDGGNDGGSDGGDDGTRYDAVYELRSGRKYQYWINVPKNATSGMPLIVFLHGDGERGAPYALEASSTIVPMVKYLINGYNGSTPYITLVPVLPTSNSKWTDSPSSLKSLIDGVVSEYKIDKKRIYIIGFSRGATGLWKIVNDYPDYFAAAVPVSNYPQYGESALNFKHTKIWAVAGGYETTPGWNVRDNMSDFVNSINHVGGQAKMEIYPYEYHGTISGALRNSELVNWLLKQ